MPIEPEHPTEKYIRGRIGFHEDQASWFSEHDQPTLAEWARSTVWTLRKQLAELKAKEGNAK